MITKLTEEEKHIMKRRGFDTEDQMLAYLNYTTDMLPAFSSLLNGEKLLDALLMALDRKAVITVYGDYDADGIMAMTILYKGLKKLGAGSLHWFANNRFKNGYSITPESLSDCLTLYPDTQVILTCDNGIGAVEAWEKAAGLGIEVLVTDHHEQAPDRVLPDEIPAVCEKSVAQKEQFAKEGREPEDFCGAELARRLILELFERTGQKTAQEAFLDSLYAYAGLATVTDVVPLKAGNRAVLKRGLSLIRQDTGIWRRLYQTLLSGKTPQEALDEEVFGFYYGPAINASGRINGNVDLPMKVFLTPEDQTRDAMDAAVELSQINAGRREFASEDLKLCRERIKAGGYENSSLILIAEEKLREGINGLTAGRICEEYRVPVIVLGGSDMPGVYKGSARSTDACNIFEALYECRDLLIAFGGHPKAAGLSVRAEDIDELRRRLEEKTKNLKKETPLQEVESDYPVRPEQISVKWIADYQSAVSRLAPFGEGFAAPQIYLEGQAAGIRLMSGDTHAKVMMKDLSQDGKGVNLLMWGKGEYCKEYLQAHGQKPPFVKGFVTRPEINEFRQTLTCQFVEKEIEFSENP